MSVNRLRWLLSERHIDGFRDTPGLLDIETFDPHSQERIQRIYCQLTAALVLKQRLEQLQVPTGNRLDLLELIDKAFTLGIIDDRVARILQVINHEANEAKHELYFRSRL